MTTLATLVVKLMGDTSDFRAKAEETQGTVGKLGGAFGNLGGVLKVGLLGGVGVAAGAVVGLGAVLTDSVGEAMAAQEVMTQLESVLASTGGAAGVTAAMATGLADSLSGVTRFEDDAILAGENLLLTFTNIGSDVFPTATETMLNMSQALGQDLSSSAVQLGKALNDPTQGMTALSRVGVSFTEEQKNTIKALQESGDLMGAQTIILDELGREFGGAAEAAGGTFAGQLDIMKNSLGNVKEEIGFALLPALTSLAQTLGPVLMSAAQGLANFLITTVVPALSTLFTWVATNLPPALQTLANFWTNTLQPALAAVWGFIQGSVIPILQTLFEWLATNIPPALQTLADFWTNTLQPALAAVWEFIQTNVVPILQTLFEWLATNIPPALQTLADFWTNTLQPAIAGVWDFLQVHVIPLFEALVNVYIAALKLALTLLAGIWNTVLKPALEKVWDFLQAHVIPIFQTLMTKLDGPVSQALRDLAALLKGAFKKALEIVTGLLDGVTGAITGISGAIQDVIDWITRMAEKLGSIKLPKWLTPGSPTPFEIGLLGIAAGLQEATSRTREFGGALGQLTAAAPASLAELGTIIQDIVAWLTTLAGYFGDPTHGVVAAKAVVDALKPIFEGILPLIDGVIALADLTLPAQAALDQLDNFFALIADLVARMATLAPQFEVEGVAAAAVFAEAAGKITSQLKALVDGFTAVAGYAGERIDPALDVLIGQLQGTIRKLLRVAPQFEAEGVAAAAAFAQTGALITNALKLLVDGFTAVAGYAGERIGPALDVLIGQLQGTMRKLARAAGEIDSDALTAAAGLAAAGAGILQPLKTMVDGFTAVAEYAQGKMVKIGPALDVLIGQLQGLVRKLARAAGELETQALPAAIRLAAAGGEIAKNMQAVVDGLTAVGSYVVSRKMDTSQAFVDALSALVGALETAGKLFSEEGLAGAVALAEAAGKIGRQVENAIEGLLAVAAYTGQRLEYGARRFAEDAATMVNALAEAGKGFSEEALRGAMDLAEAAGKIGDQIESSIAGMKAIMGYAGGLGIDAVTRLVNDLLMMVQGMARAANQIMTANGLEAAMALAEVAGKIGSSVEATAQGLVAVMGYAGGLTQEAIDRFVADMVLLVQGLVLASSQISAEGLAAARTLGEAAGVIGDGVVSMQDALVAITDYKPPNPARFDEFAADVYTMIEKLRIVASVLGEDAIKQAVAFATAGATIYQAIEDGIDSVLGITSSGGMGGVAAAMQEMVGHVASAVGSMATEFSTLVDDAYDFGQGWVDGIMDGLNSRLDDLEELMAYIRGLFPSSPAKYGAWRDLPDGRGVGEAFTAAMAGAVESGSASVASALGGLRGAFAGGSDGWGAPGGAGGGGIYVTVNVAGDGDPRAIQDATRLGVMEAARAVGLA